MILDATLAYLHFAAILALAGFLVAEADAVARRPRAGATSRRLSRTDLAYFLPRWRRSRTGTARVFFGAKGVGFYVGNPVFWTKVALFIAVALVSIKPTIAFGTGAAPPATLRATRCRRRRCRAPGASSSSSCICSPSIPLAAVLMARGIGH